MVRVAVSYLYSNLYRRIPLKQITGASRSLRRYSSVIMAKPAVEASSNYITKVTENIVKSEQDKRQYKGLELNNGLKVLLISDPTTDKSSAALDVHIGSLSNPHDLPGLAHFLEHMLFLGTEKYPCENEYNKYLSLHGGSSNAFTASDHTNYFFDISPDYLKGALDRFAQFFICPLFTESATDREVKAVNSEHEKNLQSDVWRFDQLQRSTCDSNHDYSKFGTGNIKTLDELPKQQGVNVREELLKFHDKWYSSNIMALAVLGKENIEDLTEMVLEHFPLIKNKDVAIPEWNTHPFRDQDLRLKSSVVPVKDIRSLSITFPIPDLHPYYRSAPGHYLGHLIGHEGPGSLLSELKARSWVNSIVGGQHSGAKGFGFFIVHVDLTEEGIDHVDDIVSLTFQFLNMLKKEGPKEWIFDECKDLSAMSFRFKDKERPDTYTCSLAGLLHDYSLEEVLSGPYLLHEFKPELIDMVLSKLTPQSVRVTVTGKKFAEIADESEKWYGTQYKMEKIEQSVLDNWSSDVTNEKLMLPGQNEFVPTNFEILERDKNGSKVPVLIKNSELVKIWFKQDDEFFRPKSIVNIQFISPMAFIDPGKCNLTRMYLRLFNDALNEYAYDASLAGLSYGLTNSKYGVFLNVKGYSHKQSILLEKIMDCLTSFKVDPKRFEILKENYVRGLKNFKAEQPHQHAIYYMSLLTAEHGWTQEELLNACDELTVERLNAFIPDLLSKMCVECLLHGNVTEKHALELVSIVENKLEERMSMKPLYPSQLIRDREVQLTDGCNFVYEKENTVHSSSSIETYYQCGLQCTHSNILVELYAQLISEPCFNVLRTQEQLGYIVFSGVRSANGVHGIRVIIQSDRSPSYVDARIEKFLASMEEYINKMSDEEFEQNKKSLSEKRLEKPKRLSQQSAKYWAEISSQQYNFNRDDIEVEELKTVTKDEILKFHKDSIAYDSPLRHKLSVHIKSSAQTNDDDTDSNNLPKPQLVEDVTTFKSRLGLFPLVEPYINIPKPTSTKSKL